MKKLIPFFAVVFFLNQLCAQNYAPVDNGSEVKFLIKNFALGVNGSFKGLKGKISFNPNNPPASAFIASVDAATVNTGNDSRNNHLKKEEYFDVKRFPVISFAATKITGSTKEAGLLMEGTITIKGVSKAVSFPFTAIPKGDDYLFQGEFKLNRRDFGVGGSSMVMSDNLTVSLSVFAKKIN